MADDEKPDSETEGDEAQTEGSDARPSRGPVKLLAGIIVMVALGGALAVMAIPKKEQEHRFGGPFFVALSENPVAVNTKDANYTRYVKFIPHGEYVAYDERYVYTRSKGPFYKTYLRSRIEQVASDKDLENILKGLQREVFAEELRTALNPIVFPIHIGPTSVPLDVDPDTGLRPGASHAAATFRGRFHEHVLKVDGSQRTLQIDDGPTVTFQGTEDDLIVTAADGSHMYLDVTHYEAGFVGEVAVGVHGKLRKILIVESIAQ